MPSSNPIQDFPRVVFSLSVVLFILFIITTASIDHCEDRALTATGMTFSVISMLIALAIVIYSGVVHRADIFKLSFGRRFGRR
jgi:heme A synthase